MICVFVGFNLVSDIILKPAWEGWETSNGSPETATVAPGAKSSTSSGKVAVGNYYFFGKIFPKNLGKKLIQQDLWKRVETYGRFFFLFFDTTDGFLKLPKIRQSSKHHKEICTFPGPRIIPWKLSQAPQAPQAKPWAARSFFVVEHAPVTRPETAHLVLSRWSLAVGSRCCRYRWFWCACHV